MLVNLTRCMRYWDDLSLTQLLVGRIGHPKKDRLAEKPVLAFNSKSKIVLNVSVYKTDSLFRSNWVFREVTPVSHISLNTDRTKSFEKFFHGHMYWRFLGMTKMPLLPIRKLPEVSSIGQVS